MEKLIELRSDGLVILTTGFDNSVDARNFLAQIAYLVVYEGPESKEIIFRIDANSIQQAAEWGLERKEVLRKLRKFSQQSSTRVIPKRCYYQIWRDTKPKQEQGKYSQWFKHYGFWTRLRMTQTLWILRGFGKSINPDNLPFSMNTAIRRHKVSWAELVRFAGFNPIQESLFIKYHTWSRRKVITKLKELKRFGTPLNSLSLIQYGYAGLLSAMSQYFGSWQAAVKAAGFDPEKEWRGKRKRYTTEEVIRTIIQRQARNEKLTLKAIVRADRTLLYSAQDHFGSWTEALVVAGIDPGEVTYIRWSREGVLTVLRKLKAEGKSIHHWGINIHYPRLEGAIRRHFSSWSEAVKEAGFDPAKEFRVKVWSCEKVIEMLRELKKRGEPINSGYLQFEHKDLEQAIRKYFGSWADGIQAAGFKPDKECVKQTWNREKIIRELAGLKNLGEQITPIALYKKHRKLYGATGRHFGSWAEGIKAAGFNSTQEAERPELLKERRKQHD